MRHYLTFADDKSNKFWQIAVEEFSFTITFGRTGTTGVSQTKNFTSKEECSNEAHRLLHTKLKKGYSKPSVVKGAELPEKKESTKNQQPRPSTLLSGIEDISKDHYSLYYQDGGSDKVYHAAIEQKDNGYVVNFTFGRRGSTLKAGTKTSRPVSLEEARKILEQLVNAKRVKGYTEGLSGKPYIQTTFEQRVSGLNCQLLNSIDEDGLQYYLTSDDFGAQEKMDGNRILIRKASGGLEGINRKGLIIALPQPLHNQMQAIKTSFTIDGESIGDVIHAFDMLAIDGQDITTWSFDRRFNALTSFGKQYGNDFFKVVPLMKGTQLKSKLLRMLATENREGVVFKKLDASYKPGRPSSGGSQVKYKFYKTATVLVDKINLKRSVSLSVRKGGTLVSVGNVTIPPNYDVPKMNDCIEVRYLYAYPGGSLYQPTYLGVRNDVDPEECGVEQLVFKQSVS